ncbi:retrovirus-related pol polyprotein from transposon TNT 1-94 [Tanacetum coccineum]|uniref:Retrovirus-related pol polyprotein from transposon TNT 1-94 n=1 Tax=Tanacetum coccineum TaxID=301880 RepID=A0ABQ4YHA6_9ASTR
MMASSPIFPTPPLSKASKTKSWLWHRLLSHLNFGTINHLARHGLVRGLPKLKFKKDHLCSACAMGKSKKKPHIPKSEDTNQEKLYLLHMDLCGPMRVNTMRRIGISSMKHLLLAITKAKNGANERRNRMRMTRANPRPSTPFVPPLRTDWDILFQPMFDELLTPPPSVDYPASEVVAPIHEVVAPVPAVSTGSPSSTNVDQDAPSPSHSQTTPETQPPIIPNDVEEDNHDIEIAHMGNDPYFGIPILEIPSDQSSSSDSIHTITVSTRLQLHEQALFCYYDAFLTSIEPKTYKDALTQSCWIEAMQEELNEFERLEVWELVPRPDKVMVITLKWIYKVKLDELGEIQFDSCDPVDTPMMEKSKLDEDTEGKAVDPSHYRGMIGTLLYLTGVWYPKDSSIALTAFVDTDHAGCQDTCRSTSGSMPFLGDRLVSWSSKRQKSATISSCNNVQHSRSKHIDIRFQFIKEHVENGVIELYFINTDINWRTSLQKPLQEKELNFLSTSRECGVLRQRLKQLADEVDE